MRLDAEGRAVESWANADVGDGAAGARFACEEGARYVDAFCGEQFLFGGEVQRGEGEAAAGAGAGDDFSGEDEGAAEQAAGVGDVACGDFAADDGARDDFAFVDYGRKNDDFEAALRAKFLKHAGVAGLFVSEAEILSHKNSAHLKIADEDLIDKFLRRKFGEVVREGENDGGFDAEVRETLEALLGGGDAKRCGVWAKYLLREGIERESGRDGVDFARAGDGGAQDGLVAEVDAVKIADGQRAAAARGAIANGPGERR